MTYQEENTMNYVVDTHSHTIMSGHAYNTLAEMAAAGKAAGLEALAITDHAPGIPGTCDEIYFWNFKAIDRKIYGIELLMGCEVNILDYEGTISMSQRGLRGLDICIASIHDLCYTKGTKAENTRAYCKAMENPYVDIIGHPDDSRIPVDFEELVRCARDTGTLLELNDSSMYPKGRNGYENMKIMLPLCERYGVPITLGSDAHFFTQVGNFSRIQPVIEEVRFPEELIVNTSVDKLKKHLHKFL